MAQFSVDGVAQFSTVVDNCKRVPEIAQLLLDEASHSEEGIFKDFLLRQKMSSENLKLVRGCTTVGK